jgi:hypothetical protein
MDRTRGQHFFGMLASFPELHPARIRRLLTEGL